MSCDDELEAIIDPLCSQLQNCTVAITSICGFDADTIKTMCEIRGANARVFALSAVARSVGKFACYLLSIQWNPSIKTTIGE